MDLKKVTKKVFCRGFKSSAHSSKIIISNEFHILSYMYVLCMFVQVLGQLPPNKIAPNPKTNPKPNPNPNQVAIFLGGNRLVAPQP